jgi:predicted ATP-dependent endonuclease of OLD family
MLSNYSYACDSYVSLTDDGTSGDPHDCPKVNARKMIKEWCEGEHKATPEFIKQMGKSCLNHLESNQDGSISNNITKASIGVVLALFFIVLWA